jgi:hypothetical protein
MLGLSIDSEMKAPSEQLESEFRQWAKKGADKGFAVSQELVPQDRGASGGLLGSAFPPEFDASGTLRWGYRARQAKPMEFGTDPFHPPTAPLVSWAERVANDPGLGYYVANVKIPEEGISANPYARPGKKAQENWYESNPFSDRFEDNL